MLFFRGSGTVYSQKDETCLDPYAFSNRKRPGRGRPGGGLLHVLRAGGASHAAPGSEGVAPPPGRLVPRQGAAGEVGEADAWPEEAEVFKHMFNQFSQTLGALPALMALIRCLADKKADRTYG